MVGKYKARRRAEREYAMDSVEGFKSFNSSKAVEIFQAEKLPGIRIQAASENGQFEWSNMVRVGYGFKKLAIEFEERDRKAVADLFRKMADSLDGEELFKPGSTGRVTPGMARLMLDIDKAADLTPKQVDAIKKLMDERERETTRQIRRNNDR